MTRNGAAVLALIGACGEFSDAPAPSDLEEDLLLPDAGDLREEEKSDEEEGEHVVTRMVDEKGARVCLGDGLCVDIPPNAVPNAVEITMRDDPVFPEEIDYEIKYDRAIELEPDGLAFAVPASLEIPLGETFDPETTQVDVLLWNPPEWAPEPIAEIDSAHIAHVPIEHFSVRVARSRCQGSTFPNWQVAHQDPVPELLEQRTAYLDPVLDARRFEPNLLRGTGGTFHISNSSETISPGQVGENAGNCKQYHPDFSRETFMDGAVLYDGQALRPDSNSNSGRIYVYHGNEMKSRQCGQAVPRSSGTWRQAVIITSPSRADVNVSFRRFEEACGSALCAGTRTAQRFLNARALDPPGSPPSGMTGPQPVPADSGMLVLAGSNSWTDVCAGRTLVEYLDFTLTGRGAGQARILDVWLPLNAPTPTTVEELNALPRTCFGTTYKPDPSEPNRPWRFVHQRSRFQHADRQGTWNYNTLQGVRGVIFAQPTGATGGDQERGEDLDQQRYDGRRCVGDTNARDPGKRVQNVANYGGVYRIDLRMINPLPSMEQFYLVASFRKKNELGMTWVLSGFGESSPQSAEFIALKAEETTGDCGRRLARENQDPPENWGACTHVMHVLKTIELPAATVTRDSAGRITQTTSSTVTGRIEFTLQGGVTGSVWLALLPQRLVSVEDDGDASDGKWDDGIEMFQLDASGQATRVDKTRAPRSALELRVRLNYPIRRAVPSGAVKIMQGSTEVPTTIEVDADVRPGDPPLTALSGTSLCTTDATCGDEAFCRKTSPSATSGICLGIRKAKLLKIRPNADLAAGQTYRLEISSALKDIFEEESLIPGAASERLPGTAPETPLSASPVQWSFQTAAQVSLSVGSQTVSGECSCGIPTTCGTAHVRVSVTADSPLREGLEYFWSCDGCSVTPTTTSPATEVTLMPPPTCYESKASGYVTVTITDPAGTIIDSATAPVEALCRATSLCWSPYY